VPHYFPIKLEIQIICFQPGFQTPKAENEYISRYRGRQFDNVEI